MKRFYILGYTILAALSFALAAKSLIKGYYGYAALNVLGWIVFVIEAKKLKDRKV